MRIEHRHDFAAREWAALFRTPTKQVKGTPMTEQEAARKLACQIRINETLPLAFVQSARGAFGPINAALKGLSGIKVHELPDAGRHKHGQLRKDLEATRERLRKIYTEAANRPDWADYIVRQVRSLKDEFNIKPN